MKKIFIGMEDIASQIDDFAKGFQANGFETYTAVYNSNTPRQHTVVDNHIEAEIPKLEWFSDKALGTQLRSISKNNLYRYIYQKALKECDTFLFMWYSFKQDLSDIAELKRLGKTVLVFFVGSDVRWYHAEKQDYAPFGLLPMEYDAYGKSKTHLHTVLHYLRTFEKYADFIFSTPGQSELALRPYFNVGVPIQMDRFKEKTEQREIPTIVHAPSKRLRKGTNHILSVFEQLKSDGVKFNLQLIEEMTHLEIIKEYENADILVGQLLGPYCGKQEREALACGTVVLSSMAYDYINEKCTIDTKDTANCPIIDVNPNTLYTILKETIHDLAHRKKVAKKGRSWVEKNHSCEHVSKQISNIVTTNSKNYEFFPEFFKNNFVPNDTYLSLYNSYNSYVSSTKWYDTFIAPSNSSGLIFPEYETVEKELLVSIIIICKPNDQFVINAIESAISQTDAPNEIIVVDSYANQSIATLDYQIASQITLLEFPDKSLYQIYKTLIPLSESSHFTLLSSHDLLQENYINELKKTFQISPFASVFYPRYLQASTSLQIEVNGPTFDYFYSSILPIKRLLESNEQVFHGISLQKSILSELKEESFINEKELMENTIIHTINSGKYLKEVMSFSYVMRYGKNECHYHRTDEEQSTLIKKILNTFPLKTLFPEYNWTNKITTSTLAKKQLINYFNLCNTSLSDLELNTLICTESDDN